MGETKKVRAKYSNLLIPMLFKGYGDTLRPIGEAATHLPRVIGLTIRENVPLYHESLLDLNPAYIALIWRGIEVVL